MKITLAGESVFREREVIPFKYGERVFTEKGRREG